MTKGQKKQWQLLAPVIAGSSMVMLDMTGSGMAYAVSLLAGIVTFIFMAVNADELYHKSKEAKDLERELWDLQTDYEELDYRCDELREELNEIKNMGDSVHGL